MTARLSLAANRFCRPIHLLVAVAITVVCLLGGCATSNSSDWAQTAPSIPQSSDDSADSAMREWEAATALGDRRDETLRN